MISWRATAASVVLIASLFGGVSAVQAQSDDAADTAFWQSIQGDNDPDELRLYLQQFPNGHFARLAQQRLKSAANGARPAPQPAPPPAPPAPAPVNNGGPADPNPEPEPPIAMEKIQVSPTRARVGQIIAFTCVDFPDPSSYDQLVVVPAGSPVMEPTRAREESKVLWQEYAVRCKERGSKGGPFAPGSYEVRYMTTLYNNEQRYEMRTMTPFTVR